MKPLERRHLVRLCKKHGIDTQEIDSSLTYWENKDHLMEIARILNGSIRMEEQEKRYMTEILEMAEQEKWYMATFPLEYYRSLSLPYNIGAPDTNMQQFSLRIMSDIGFSLHTFQTQRLKT